MKMRLPLKNVLPRTAIFTPTKLMLRPMSFTLTSLTVQKSRLHDGYQNPERRVATFFDQPHRARLYTPVDERLPLMFSIRSHPGGGHHTFVCSPHRGSKPGRFR